MAVFDAEVALKCQNTLGEGITWDDRTNRLYWVDIERAEIHSWDTREDHKVTKFDEEYVSALAPRRDAPGLVAAFKSSIVTVEENGEQRVIAKDVVTGDARFNDGACDAAGRLWIGSMSFTDERIGELWRVHGGRVESMVRDVGCSNGVDWSPDNKTMYYVDSINWTVEAFDYDLETGTASNRRVFATTPKALGGEEKAKGAFDGLIVDGVGNIWVARWGDSRLVVYNPAGEIIAHIRTPGGLSPTIPCFGGEDLSTLYIASANANLAKQGDVQDQYPMSGNVFKLDISPVSELRKVLGPEWKGRVRHRFGG